MAKYEYKGWDAYPALFSSLMYLLTHPKYGAILYLLLGVGGGRFIANEVEQWTGIHIQTEGKVKAVDIGTAVPQYDTLQQGEIPIVRVQQKEQTWNAPDAIVVGKKFYGFYDRRFQLFKVKGVDEILVYSYANASAAKFKVNGSMFNEEQFK